jgi:uncharacterized protein YqgC (DUF456 family)
MDPIAQYSLQALVLAVMVVGLFGLIVPVFPGLAVIWLAALGYGLAKGFTTGAWVAFAFITILAIAGSLVDNVLMGAKAREGGASWWALASGWVGGVAGSLLLPPLGGIPGAMLGVFLYEFIHLKDWRRALRMTGGVAVGCGWAFVIRFLIGLIMIGIWMIWAF